MAQATHKVSWLDKPIPVTRVGGRKYSAVFAEALQEWERLVKAKGIRFTVTQGAFSGSVSASGNTHLGDAVDISVSGLTQAQVAEVNRIGRMLGFTSWFRTTKVGKWGTRAHGFKNYHIHAVPNLWGYPHKSARNQAASYRQGRDGLASNQTDLGPGHVNNYRTRTWLDYKALQQKPVPTPQIPTPPNTGSLGPIPDIIPRYYTRKPWMEVPVNGTLSGLTLSRLQWQLNIKPTGKLDNYTIRALKVWLGNPDDGKGILTPLNVKQLQYRVGFRGAQQDGVWVVDVNKISPTTKALQKYLNTNR